MDASHKMEFRRPRRDYRKFALVLVALGTMALGFIISYFPGRGTVARMDASTGWNKDQGFAGLGVLPTAADRAAALSETPLATSAATQAQTPLDGILQEARTLVHKRRYDEALLRLTSYQPALKNRAEAYMLVGDALVGKQDYQTARDFYNAAIDRDPMLADAYFGHAVASEGLGDLPAALGGMRSFLHTVKDASPERLKVAQARSAIWEWESKLGRGPWGPTQGIPPGFSAAELKRDGRGVAIKMPKPETLSPDGTTEYEIKHANKTKIYPRE